MSIAEAMVSESVLFQMLLKVCSKLDWSKIDQSSKSFGQFREILIQVTSESSQLGGQNHEDKSRDFLEKQLIESWERILDRNETRNMELYCPREFAAGRSDERVRHDLRLRGTEEQAPKNGEQSPQKGEKEQSVSSSPYIDTDYLQPQSSYLKGLPKPAVKRHQKEACLKLLFYWEKHVLPTTREFVKSTFQKWEMNYYFEQVRHHLRQGDQRAAISDAMTLWEQKIPQGVVLPAENTDWTAKVADEGIVDTWALAKINFSKSAGQANSQGSKAGGSTVAPEAALPLIIRL
jgi:hypothetical protein